MKTIRFRSSIFLFCVVIFFNLFFCRFSNLFFNAAPNVFADSPNEKTLTVALVDSVDRDVLVVGAGSAGVPAAAQAARAGAKTILLELGAQPGGNATTGGVNFPGLFHAWGKQVISGIPWEWVEKTVELNGATLPDFSIPTGSQHWRHQIRVDAATYAAVGEEICVESGVELRYFETICRLEALPNDSEIAKIHDDANWRATTISQGEFREIFCKQIVDCSGNGSICALAGAELLRDKTTQPGTFNYRIESGVDVAKIDDATKTEIKTLFDKALQSGVLERSDMRDGILNFLAGNTINYVVGADNSTGVKRTETNVRGRSSMLRALRFVRTLPGGDNAKIVSASPEVGVRETYRVRCEYETTGDDYASGRVWDDSIAFAFYPIDLHDNNTGVRPAHLQEGVVATVPLRSLQPANVPNIWVAGRCVGSDRLANSALRVQATCGATGQAAGGAAALVARKKIDSSSIDVDELKKLLRESGAIVP